VWLTVFFSSFSRLVINAATPRMGLFIFLIIAVQFVLAAGYIYYKRRRNSMPKKFL
jgi:mannose-binding lectin 1